MTDIAADLAQEVKDQNIGSNGASTSRNLLSDAVKIHNTQSSFGNNMADNNSLNDNDSIVEPGSEKGDNALKQEDKSNSQKPETEKGGSQMG